MIEQAEMKKNDNFSFKSKLKNIEFVNQWGLVISGGLTVITLFITWIFFISTYRSRVDELLAEISNNGFNFNFVDLSLSMYVFMLVFVGIFVLFFIFFKKHNVISIFIIFSCLGVSGLLLLFLIIFGGIASSGFQAYIANNGISNILFFVIPWVFTIIFTFANICFSCWSIIIFFPKKTKSVFLNLQSVIEEKQSAVNHNLHRFSNNNHALNMENNEILIKTENQPISLEQIDQQEMINSMVNNKRPMRKKSNDVPDFQSLENIRLQVQPDSSPAILPTASNSEIIKAKIEKKLVENDSKLEFNSNSNTIKNKEEIITELQNNKRIVNEVTQMPLLKAQVSQPLHENEEKIYAKDLTLNVDQEPIPFFKNNLATEIRTDNQEQMLTTSTSSVKDNVLSSQSIVVPSPNSSVINQPPIATIDYLAEPKPIKIDSSANLKIFNSNSDAPSVQQEHTNKFVQNVYPSKPPVQGVPPSTLPVSADQQSSLVNDTQVTVSKPVLTVQVSQPLNPQPPEPETTISPPVPLKVWTNEQINRAWERGLVVATYEPEAYRSDYAGALMFKGSFVANPNSEENNNVRSYSWTIVHQRPLEVGGSEESNNLWPLNCMNALAKGQDYPRWKTTVTFNGRENILKVKKWKGKRKLAKK